MRRVKKSFSINELGNVVGTDDLSSWVEQLPAEWRDLFAFSYSQKTVNVQYDSMGELLFPFGVREVKKRRLKDVPQVLKGLYFLGVLYVLATTLLLISSLINGLEIGLVMAYYAPTPIVMSLLILSYLGWTREKNYSYRITQLSSATLMTLALFPLASFLCFLFYYTLERFLLDPFFPSHHDGVVFPLHHLILTFCIVIVTFPPIKLTHLYLTRYANLDKVFMHTKPRKRKQQEDRRRPITRSVPKVDIDH